MAIIKKGRKQQLREPDGFLTFSRKLLAWVIRYKVYAISALVLILSLAMLVSGIRYMGNRAENQAFTLLDKGISAYEQTSQGDGPVKAYEKASETFQTLIDEYSGRSGGKLGRIVYAGMAYDAADFDKALALYQAALDDADAFPALKPLVLGGLARTYAAKEDYEQAARYFEMITKGDGPLLKEDAYLNLGLIYDRMGKPEKRTEVFKKFIAEYPDSTYAAMVKEKLANS